jgi:hypothetical protein
MVSPEQQPEVPGAKSVKKEKKRRGVGLFFWDLKTRFLIESNQPAYYKDPEEEARERIASGNTLKGSPS